MREERAFLVAIGCKCEVVLPLGVDQVVTAFSSPQRQLELFALRPRQAAPDPALRTATVVLKATLDLVIERTDGSIDVIDYKRSRGGDEDRYSFQLAAYREAALRHYGADRVRTGLVHLLGDDNEPDWQSSGSFDFFELGARLVEARFHDAWPSIAEPACRKAQCGFVSACHGPRFTGP